MADPRLARRAILLAALAVPAALAAGCAPGPGGPGAVPGGSVRLPPDAVVGAGDPTRAAILNTAYAFASPANLAGRPAEAARAVANFEYLAAGLAVDPRYREASPLLQGQLEAGRVELREAVGIAPGAAPQAVIDALYAAFRALGAGDRVAAERILTPPNFTPGGAATIERLAALPALPKTNFAAAFAQAEMIRIDQQGRQGEGGPTGRRR
jgi:hypothetical protein